MPIEQLHTLEYLTTNDTILPDTSARIYILVITILCLLSAISAGYIFLLSYRIRDRISIWIFSTLASSFIATLAMGINGVWVVKNNGWRAGGTECILTYLLSFAPSGTYFLSIFGTSVELYMNYSVFFGHQNYKFIWLYRVGYLHMQDIFAFLYGVFK
jgi:hypothetical protein